MAQRFWQPCGAGALGLALLLAACAPAPPAAQPAAAPSGASASAPARPAAAPAQADWAAIVAAAPSGASAPAPARPAAAPAQADWAAIVAAAQREGVVNCGCPPRPDFSQTIKEGFEAANPGIRVEVTAAPLPDFWVKVDKEQEAGQYLWDVYMFGVDVQMFDLKNRGGIEPFRDYMVGPDVGTDADWEGGLNGRFVDKDKQYIFGYWTGLTNQFSVNRDVLPNAKIANFQDVTDPAYKGKIVWQDPRVGGTGVNMLTAIYRTYGREGLRKILVDQEPLLLRGGNEVAEQHVRGARPVALNRASPDALIPFQNAGVRLNLEITTPEDLSVVSTVGSSPTVLKNPPHPNATKVFLNWVLSKEGQTLLSDKLRNNSARKGVPVVDEQAWPQPGKEYFQIHQEENMTGIVPEAQRVARELVP